MHDLDFVEANPIILALSNRIEDMHPKVKMRGVAYRSKDRYAISELTLSRVYYSTVAEYYSSRDSGAIKLGEIKSIDKIQKSTICSCRVVYFIEPSMGAYLENCSSAHARVVLEFVEDTHAM